MAAKPSTTKSAGKTAKPRGRPFVKGDPRAGVGKKGRSGRPPQAFKDFLATLRQHPEVQAALERAAKDETSSGFRAALSVMVQYDEDKPAEKHEVNLNVALAEKLRSARERAGIPS